MRGKKKVNENFIISINKQKETKINVNAMHTTKLKIGLITSRNQVDMYMHLFMTQLALQD